MSLHLHFEPGSPHPLVRIDGTPLGECDHDRIRREARGLEPGWIRDALRAALNAPQQTSFGHKPSRRDEPDPELS